MNSVCLHPSELLNNEKIFSTKTKSLIVQEFCFFYTVIPRRSKESSCTKSLNDYYADYYEEDYRNERAIPEFFKLYRTVHVISEVYPYWIQVTLTLALAIERYVLIVKGVDAKQILTKRNRKIFYFFVAVLGFVPPSLIMTQMGYRMISGVSSI